MMNLPALVSIVDDDESVRESLPDLLKDVRFGVSDILFC
jgi:FixJ family two-component response regulator